MKLTIATLYRGDLCETYVAALEGDTTEEDEALIAESMRLRMEDGDALDWIGFCGVELQDPKGDGLLFSSATQGDMRYWTAEGQAQP